VIRPGVLIRLEGLTAAVLVAALYAFRGGGWLWFAVLFLVPDLSMLGYLAGPRVGAAAYNLLHTYTTAGVLAGVGVVTGHGFLVLCALILGAHIGVDRLLGYGLKYPTGFKDTHLQRL